MKHLPIAASLLVLCFGCSTKPEEKVPADEKVPAITVTDVNVYGSATEIKNNVRSGDLISYFKVFLEKDSIIVADKKYVLVSFGEHRGYVDADLVLAGGRQGVIFGPPGQRASIFRDKEMTVVVTTLGTSVLAVGRQVPGGWEVAQMYGGLRRGYCKASSCFVDSADVVFVRRFLDAKDAQMSGNSKDFDLLFRDPAFSGRPLRNLCFGDYHPRTPADSIHHELPAWDKGGSSVAQNDVPGAFGVGFVFNDQTESTRNHLGDVLSTDNSVDCTRDGRTVSDLRLYFVPAVQMDYFIFSASTKDQEGKEFQQQDSVKMPEVGKRYSMKTFHGDCDVVYLKLLTSSGYRGSGTIGSSCGD